MSSTIRALALAVVAGAATAQGQHRLVIRTGSSVPTAAGTRLVESFAGQSTGRSPQIDDEGAVAFFATTSGPFGSWSITSAGLVRPMAINGEFVPGSKGTLAYSQSVGGAAEPQIAGQGIAAAMWGVTGSGLGSGRTALVGGHLDNMGVPLAPNRQVPAMPDGVRLFSVSQPATSASGYLNVNASLTGGGVTSQNDAILWQAHGAVARVIVREGSQAPSEANGVVFDNLFASRSVDTAGRVAFSGTVRGPGVSRTERSWRETPSGLELVYSSGTTLAPGFNDGTVIYGPTPRFSSTGRYAALSGVLDGPTVNQTNNFGVWFWDGDYTQVARLGGTVQSPTGSRTIHSLQGASAQVTESGHLITPATTRDGNGVLRGALLAGDSTGVSVIFETGADLPGLATGVTASGIKISDVNDQGWFVLFAQLQGSGVTSSNNTALFASNLAGELQFVVREGDLFEYDNGMFATVTKHTGSSQFAEFTGVPINASGTMLFSLAFDNGIEGLYTVQVPSPAAGLVVLAGLIGVMRRRKAP